MWSKYTLKVKLPWHFTMIDKSIYLQGSDGVLRWAHFLRAAWLKVLWHVLGHVLDAFLCSLSLCHSGCCPCSCWLVCGTSPSAARWVTALIRGFPPLFFSQQGGWKHTWYPWNWDPRCEQDVVLLILLIPWCESFHSICCIWRSLSPYCLQWDSTQSHWCNFSRTRWDALLGWRKHLGCQLIDR